MSAERTAARLAALYPPGWRARYGAELEALILDMSDGRRVPWRARADVALAGAREWLRPAARGSAPGSPRDRLHGGLALVLWAWALFIVAGVIVQKSSEHWQDVLGGGHPVASASFTALVLAAALCGALVLGGIALAVPAFLRALRAGGLPRLGSSIRLAAALSALWVATGAAVIIWAHHLTAHARDGADTRYAVVAAAWALLGAFALAAWTAAATRAAACLELPAGLLRVEGRLAAAAGVLMVTMALATGVWWVAVASASPAALQGTFGHGYPALRPVLVVAMVLMLVAVGLAIAGTRRAFAALPRLTDTA